jgi:hypothetical protein
MVDDDYDGSNFVVKQVFFCVSLTSSRAALRPRSDL